MSTGGLVVASLTRDPDQSGRRGSTVGAGEAADAGVRLHVPPRRRRSARRHHGVATPERWLDGSACPCRTSVGANSRDQLAGFDADSKTPARKSPAAASRPPGPRGDVVASRRGHDGRGSPPRDRRAQAGLRSCRGAALPSLVSAGPPRDRAHAERIVPTPAIAACVAIISTSAKAAVPPRGRVEPLDSPRSASVPRACSAGAHRGQRAVRRRSPSCRRSIRAARIASSIDSGR